MIRIFCACAALALGGPTSVANAQDTVDIGVLKHEEISVVQKLLYPKTGGFSIGAHLGVIPFDAYVVSPNAQISFVRHKSETLAYSALVGLGWGFKTGTYNELLEPPFGVAPAAFRYLGSALLGVEWSPIYAKLNLNGARIVHFDVYLAGRGGFTVEQSVIPDGGLAYGPTLSPGIGGRFFLDRKTFLSIELRDDLIVERRELTDSFDFKQNANLTVGLSFLSGNGR